MMTFSKARSFIYRNARPLDLARWQYHFENGSQKVVLNALSHYQNDDGGFGHGLEPDLWNELSSPFATSVAISILREISFYMREDELIRGILSFLGSTEHRFDQGWLQKIPSNNDYPHAPWWTYSEETAKGFDSDFEYNPTASLAGFILRTAPNKSAIFETALRIAAEAVQKITGSGEIERHELGCYCAMVEDLSTVDCELPFSLAKLVESVKKRVNSTIEKDPTKWAGYVARPSDFIRSRTSIFYAANRDVVDDECDYIVETQLEDGSWTTPWAWDNYPEEWVISKNRWKSIVVIQNMLYLKEMDRL